MSKHVQKRKVTCDHESRNNNSNKKRKKKHTKKTSSQQSWRYRNNEVKEALIDSSVSTHGDISIAYRNELTDSLWAIFFEGASKQDIFESECSPNPNPKNIGCVQAKYLRGGRCLPFHLTLLDKDKKIN